MSFCMSVSELESQFPFQEPTVCNDFMPPLPSSLDLSNTEIHNACIRTMALTSISYKNNVDAACKRNVEQIQHLFTHISSSLGSDAIRDIIQLPMQALTNAADNEITIYTKTSLSGLYRCAYDMAAVLDKISRLPISPSRQNVNSIILSTLFATKLIKSSFFKPYSVIDAMASTNTYMQEILQDDLESLRKNVELLYDYTLKYKHVLYEKKRQLTRVNEYGFEDTKEWDAEVTTFAREVVGHHPQTANGNPALAVALIHLVSAFMVDSALKDAAEGTTHSSGPAEPVVSSTRKGIDFEQHCMSVLQEGGWAPVSTPKTGDKGVDIVATKRGLRIAVQCKSWGANVGSSAVQQIYTGSKFYDADAAVLLSETPLTAQAEEIARKLHVIAATVEDIPTLEVIIIKALIKR